MSDEILEDTIMDEVTALPPSLMNNLAVSGDFYKMAFQFQQIMMIYESAIKQIETKLDILNKESSVNRTRNPISTVKSRIKSPESIAHKLEKKGLPINFESMMKNLNDIAGVRVICPYISDIYSVRDMLLKQPDLTLIKQNDYIENPKESGYRSLHLVMEIPVYLSKTEHHVRVEIQLRTIAMDFWASLEHQLKYKPSTAITPEISEELRQCADRIAETDLQMQRIYLQLNEIEDIEE